MVEKSGETVLERLRRGEKVVCVECGEGIYVPFNTTPDKAHWFDCSNPNCDGYVHLDPVINIE